MDGIGQSHPTLEVTGGVAAAMSLNPASPYHDALALIEARAQAALGGRRLAAVAHRVVHGGSKYFEPVIVDSTVLADLRSYIPLAPLHQPFALDAIESMLQAPGASVQVACFDTAFHQTIPKVEQMLPLPQDGAAKGMRRYGFHGLSYEFMSVALSERYGPPARGRLIAAHLGSGASLCAMRDLRSAATTMGFSALDGLMMGTRCGAVDPGALLYLLEEKHLSVSELTDLLYHRSGLLGVSGVSSDPRVLLEHETEERVRDALALYVRRIVREIGSLIAVLGGLEMLVFTAGIGEHNPTIRARVCEQLEFLKIQLDPRQNAQNATLISAAESKVRVCVEPTNEEWIAARAADELLRRTGR